MLHVPAQEKIKYEQTSHTKAEVQEMLKKEKDLQDLVAESPKNPLAFQSKKAVAKYGHAAKSTPSLIDHFEIPLLLVTYFCIAWAIGYYGYGFYWFFGALVAMILLYKRRLARYSELELHALERDIAKRCVPTHEESAEWINYILGRIWGVYEPVLCATVMEVVNEALEDACPSFLNALKLTTFTLGSEAPVILGFRRYPDTPDDVIHFEVRFAFVPRRSTSDIMYPLRRGTAHRVWASQVVLAARFGSSLVGVDVPVLVENISVQVHARIQLKLMPALPVIKIAQVALMSPPKVDFVLKPLKTLDIMDLPGLHSFLNSIIDTVASKIAVAPNCITINVDEVVNSAIIAMQKPVGVLCIGVIGAKIPKTNEYVGTVDPLVSIVLNGMEVFRTREIVDQQEPRWCETFWVLIPNDKSKVHLQVIHAASLITKELTLGAIELDMENLFKSAKENSSSNEKVPFSFSGWAPYHPLSGDTSLSKGELQYSIGFFPTLGWIAPEEDGMDFIDGAGVLDLTLHQAVELTPKKSTQAKAMNVYAEGAIVPSHLFESGSHDKLRMDSFAMIPAAAYFKTHTKKKTNAPLWSQRIKTFVKDASAYTLWIQIREERELAGPSLIGELILPLANTLLQKNTMEDDWFPLNRNTNGSGKARITYTWDPIPTLEDAESIESEAVGGESGSSAKAPSIGVTHVTILEASGFKHDALSIGSKVYLTAFLGGPKGSSGAGESILCTRILNVDDSGGAPLRFIWLDGTWAFIKKEEGTIVFEMLEAGPRPLLDTPVKGMMRNKSDRLLATCTIKLADVIQNPEAYLSHWVPMKAFGSEEKEYCQLRIELAAWSLLPPPTNLIATPPKGLLRVRLLHGSMMVEPATEENFSFSSLVSVVKLLGGPNDQVLEEFISTGAKKGASYQPEWKHIFEWIILNTHNSRVSFSFGYRSRQGLERTQCEIGSFVMDTSKLIQIASKQGEKEGGTLIPFDHFDASFFKEAKAGIFMDMKFLPFDMKSKSEQLDELLQFVSEEEVPGYMVLRVHSGASMRAVDSGGTSDPFTLIKLNGVKIGKTSVIKKTLNPDWNERFLLPVRSFRYAVLGLEVFDWNRIDSFVHLGTLSLPIMQIIRESTLKSSKSSNTALPIYKDLEPDMISDEMLGDFSTPLSDTQGASSTVKIQVAYVENRDQFSSLSDHLYSSGGLMTSTKGFFKGVGSAFVGATSTVAAAPMVGGKFLAKKGLGLFLGGGSGKSKHSKSTEERQVSFKEESKLGQKITIKIQEIKFGKQIPAQAVGFYIKARIDGILVAKTRHDALRPAGQVSQCSDAPTNSFDLGEEKQIVFFAKFLNQQEEVIENEILKFTLKANEIPQESHVSLWLEDVKREDGYEEELQKNDGQVDPVKVSRSERDMRSKSMYFESLLNDPALVDRFRSNFIQQKEPPSSIDHSYLHLLINYATETEASQTIINTSSNGDDDDDDGGGGGGGE